MITEELRRENALSTETPSTSQSAAPIAEELNTREVAEETLQGLLHFVSAIRELCLSVGERLWSGEDVAQDFNRMIDGIEILVEGVQTARIVLNIERHETTDLLHQELVTRLHSLMDAMASSAPGSLDQRVELLTQSLPANLEKWVGTGIPSLMRSRDC